MFSDELKPKLGTLTDPFVGSDFGTNVARTTVGDQVLGMDQSLNTVIIMENDRIPIKYAWGCVNNVTDTVLTGSGPGLQCKLRGLLESLMLQKRGEIGETKKYENEEIDENGEKNANLNPNLIPNGVQTVIVLDKFENETIQLLIGDIIDVSRAAGLLQRLYVSDPDLRQKLKERGSFASSLGGDLAQIDSLQDLFDVATNCPDVIHLVLSLESYRDVSYAQFDSLLDTVNPHLHKIVQFFSNLETLTCELEDEKLNDFSWMLLNKLPSESLPNLKGVAVKIHYKEDPINDAIFRMAMATFAFLPFANLESFSLSIGCDSADDSEYENRISMVLDCVESIEYATRVYISQCDGPARLSTHLKSSKWDVLVFRWLLNTSLPRLENLAILPKAAENGVYDDGLEGNYLQRLKLYTESLPVHLSKIEGRHVSLNYDTLLTIAACYEQPMNNLIWNGCKCSHCNQYLGALDKFLMTHKFYRSETKHWKDMTTCQMFITIFDALRSRISDRFLWKIYEKEDDLLLKKIDWDIHNTLRYKFPIRCLHHQTFEEAEFEDEAEEKEDDGEDIDHTGFFDASELKLPCGIDDRMFPKFAVSVSHFVNSFLTTILNLDRGDAEAMEIGNENDGSGAQIFSIIQINGLVYEIGQENNGTNKFKCILD